MTTYALGLPVGVLLTYIAKLILNNPKGDLQVIESTGVIGLSMFSVLLILVLVHFEEIPKIYRRAATNNQKVLP